MGELTASPRGERPAAVPIRGKAASDSGQVSVEFLGMMPIILLTLVLLWQCALLGYTYTLAGNAADKAARQAAVAADSGESLQAACERAGKEDLEGDWKESARFRCRSESGLVKVAVDLKVPVLFPGTVTFPFSVTGDAAAVEED